MFIKILTIFKLVTILNVEEINDFTIITLTFITTLILFIIFKSLSNKFINRFLLEHQIIEIIILKIEYSDFLNIDFDSFIIPTNQLIKNEFRLLDVDNRCILPFNFPIRILLGVTYPSSCRIKVNLTLKSEISLF
ncbi:COX2 oxidase, partial [Pseudoatta argentina]